MNVSIDTICVCVTWLPHLKCRVLLPTLYVRGVEIAALQSRQSLISRSPL